MLKQAGFKNLHWATRRRLASLLAVFSPCDACHTRAWSSFFQSSRISSIILPISLVRLLKKSFLVGRAKWNSEVALEILSKFLKFCRFVTWPRVVAFLVAHMSTDITPSSLQSNELRPFTKFCNNWIDVFENEIATRAACVHWLVILRPRYSMTSPTDFRNASGIARKTKSLLVHFDF